jgi:branched-chain amino acid transport system ATP-binding protein
MMALLHPLTRTHAFNDTEVDSKLPNTNILTLRSVAKSFAGLKAVNGVSLEVHKNSLTALIGPNGAGKTTLFALISGFIKPDTGTIEYNGHDITGVEPFDNARNGLTRTFQIVQPFAGQTVLENVAVGAHLHYSKRSQALEYASFVIEKMGLLTHSHKLSSDLTIAFRKRLELAKALATQPQLILLDEVLAGLNPREIQEMIPLVKSLVSDGVTVLMIEHVMQAVMNLAEKVYVLDHGALIAEGTPSQVTQNETVIEAYLGKGTAERLNRKSATLIKKAHS